MTTDTEDLLWRRFNEWFRSRRPDYPSEWDAYQAGHADAKAETADVGEPVAMVQCHGSAEHPLCTADQLAAAVAAARISALCDTLLNRPARNAGLESEYAAEAAAKAETAAPVAGRWYFVTNDGAATLCVDEADARESATEADIAFPRMAPHRAVQLVPADQLAAAVAKERHAKHKLLEVLQGILNTERGVHGHIILHGWQEEVIRAEVADADARSP